MFAKVSKVLNCKRPRLKLPGSIVKLYGRINSFSAKILKFHPSVTHELAQISCEKHYYSSQKAVQHLKLPQTPIEKGIKDCYDWFNDNGYL